MLFDSTTECEEVKAFVREANEQNFDRLEAELAKIAITGADEPLSSYPSQSTNPNNQ